MPCWTICDGNVSCCTVVELLPSEKVAVVKNCAEYAYNYLVGSGGWKGDGDGFEPEGSQFVSGRSNGGNVRPVDFSWFPRLLIHYYCFRHDEWLIRQIVKFKNGNTETREATQKICGTRIKRRGEKCKKSNLFGSMLLRRG